MCVGVCIDFKDFNYKTLKKIYKLVLSVENKSELYPQGFVA